MLRCSPAAQASGAAMTGRLVAAAATALALGAPVRADEPHSAEIKTFARVMAIARTVRDECPGITPDERLLEVMRLRLHVVEADHSAFAPEAHAAAEELKQGLAEAPSRRTWCDAVFLLYGTEGTLMRGMLRH